MGVQVRMLGALQAFYSHARECVKSAEERTTNVLSSIGVKQGCPLAPSLFGICIHNVHKEFVCANITKEAQSLDMERGMPAPSLLDVDDIAFSAFSQSELEQLHIYGFCLHHLRAYRAHG